MDKIEYLNKRINDKNTPYNVPKSLFKYRPFDNHTYDMFDNNYVFLCQVKRLDDKEECDANINISQIYETETDNLKKECNTLFMLDGNGIIISCMDNSKFYKGGLNYYLYLIFKKTHAKEGMSFFLPNNCI